MTAVSAGVVGAIGTFFAMAGVRSTVSHRTRHLKENYRGQTLIATAGMVLLFPLGLGAASVTTIPRVQTAHLVALAGAPFVMAVLGLIDDLYGSRRAGGLVGHARELFRGRVTTGLLKAVGGVLTGLAAAALLDHSGVWIIVAGAVIAMSANLANLLDVRPARTVKAWVPVAVIYVATTASEPSRRIVGSLIGGVVVFAYFELREVVMLGDVGANLLGAALGVAVVATLGRPALVVCAAGLLLLTLVSEFVSFTRIIESVPPLRWLDRLGRLP